MHLQGKYQKICPVVSIVYLILYIFYQPTESLFRPGQPLQPMQLFSSTRLPTAGCHSYGNITLYPAKAWLADDVKKIKNGNGIPVWNTLLERIKDNWSTSLVPFAYDNRMVE